MPENEKKFPFFMIGNKKDLADDQRQISASLVKSWAQKNGEIPHEETSALQGDNIEEAFEKIA